MGADELQFVRVTLTCYRKHAVGATRGRSSFRTFIFVKGGVEGEGFGLRGEIEFGDGSVERFLGHLSVGGPFPAGDGDEAGGGDVDEVVSDEGFCVLGLWITD